MRFWYSPAAFLGPPWHRYHSAHGASQRGTATARRSGGRHCSQELRAGHKNEVVPQLQRKTLNLTLETKTGFLLGLWESGREGLRARVCVASSRQDATRNKRKSHAKTARKKKVSAIGPSEKCPQRSSDHYIELGVRGVTPRLRELSLLPCGSERKRCSHFRISCTNHYTNRPQWMDSL